METIKNIKTARIMGLLLSSGFTNWLVNKPEPTTIYNNETRQYNMLSLDSFLVNLSTRFNGLN
jgi:hypothetical protein